MVQPRPRALARSRSSASAFRRVLELVATLAWDPTLDEYEFRELQGELHEIVNDWKVVDLEESVQASVSRPVREVFSASAQRLLEAERDVRAPVHEQVPASGGDQRPVEGAAVRERERR